MFLNESLPPVPPGIAPELPGAPEDIGRQRLVAVPEVADCVELPPSNVADLDEIRERVARMYGPEDAPDPNASNMASHNAGSGDATVIPLWPELDTTFAPPAMPTIDAKVTALAERAKPKAGAIRPARITDIERLVDLDMRAFRKVYDGYGMSPEELREDLITKFTGRFHKVGGDWIQVYEQDAEVRGFMISCPTSKRPEDFKSWEHTTDNGTLETTYDPNGKNIYVVSLTMDNCGQAARNMIFMDQIGKMIKEGRENFFFESRLPGLQAWMRKECERRQLDFDGLDTSQQQELAETYFHATRTNSKGKEVPLDHLIRIYTGVGCEFVKLVPNAYKDEPSMNFGAVGVLRNPVPRVLRHNRLAKKVIGGSLRLLAHYPKLAEKVFK